MNEKILPYYSPTYCAYNYVGALDVCGQCDPQMNEWIVNSYILWKYNIDNNYITLIRSGVFGLIPFMYNHRMWKRHIKNNYREIFKTLLDDDFYVYYCNVDDYYIPTTSAYNKRHFPHDGLIYGYNENKHIYYVCAYNSTGIYTNFEVPMELFDKAWYSKYNMSDEEQLGEGTIIGLRLDPNAGYKADIDAIFKDIKRYVNSEIIDKNTIPVVFGLNVYKEIDKKINATIKGETVFKDKRLLKILSEHKLAMKRRFEFLYNNSIIPQDMLKDYGKVYDLAEITRMVHLKYSLTNNQKLLCKIRDNINRIGDEEYRLLNKIK